MVRNIGLYFLCLIVIVILAVFWRGHVQPKLEIHPTTIEKAHVKSIDIEENLRNEPMVNHGRSEEACLLLQGEEKWRKLSFKVWARNQLNEETIPRKLDDPIVMLRKKNGEKLHKPFVVCTLAKNGCSRWRRLFRRVIGYSDYLGYPHNRNTNGLQYTNSVQKRALNNTFRWAIVRDPYERLLSAWSEKCNTTTEARIQNCHWLPCRNKRNFKSFVKCLFRLYSSKPGRQNRRLCDIDEHFRPQSCSCYFKQFRYDALLPVEQIDRWYDPLISCLGIQEEAQKFWKDGQPFYAPRAGFHSSRGSAATNAGSRVARIYTKELFDMVSIMYKDDLLFQREDSALKIFRNTPNETSRSVQ